jgi:phage-related minor tail protein
MAHRTDDLQQDIADTRQDIADTRSAMTEKLEMLEERVWETVEGAQASVEGMVENVKDLVDTTVEAVRQGVEGAQSSVDEIVENVKDTVGDTVATVQRTFNLPSQVEHHPWLMLSGSVLVGYLLGSRGGGRRSAAVSTHDPQSSALGTTAALSASYSRPGSLTASSESPTRPQPQQRMGSGVLAQFKDEIALIKGAAMGAVISTLRDMVKQALLPPAPHITSAMTKGSAQSSERPMKTPASRSSTTVNGSAIF